MLYSELQCSDAIHKAVERMGFAEMTEIQEKTIPVMMAGYDVIAKLFLFVTPSVSLLLNSSLGERASPCGKVSLWEEGGIALAMTEGVR